MADTDQSQEQELVFDKSNLYKEKTYTDLKTGSIKQLIPVKADGSKDESRTPMFMGQTQEVLVLHCNLEAVEGARLHKRAAGCTNASGARG